MNLNVTIHVEVLLKEDVEETKTLKEQVQTYLSNQGLVYNGVISTHPSLLSTVLEIKIVDAFPRRFFLRYPCQPHFKLHFFTLNVEESEDVVLEDNQNVCSISLLPHKEYHGLWEALLFDHNIKLDLLNFIQTSILFSEKKVNLNTITWNRVVLLYGPPGTGKTSLCKALAQKIVIRHSDMYSYGHLVEISAHSLFSKWFSESGKLVKSVFSKVFELIEEEEAIVFVLIDEVESLAVTRNKAIQGSEPSDSIRAVNAFLTQLDQLKYHDNVVVLTTSNLEKSVDNAFFDRADIKQYIGYPSEKVVYNILKECIIELMDKTIIHPRVSLPDYEGAEIESELMKNKSFDLLLKAAGACKNVSGRFLRKLPFLSHVYFVGGKKRVSFGEFLKAMMKTLQKISDNKEKMYASM